MRQIPQMGFHSISDPSPSIVDLRLSTAGHKGGSRLMAMINRGGMAPSIPSGNITSLGDL